MENKVKKQKQKQKQKQKSDIKQHETTNKNNK